MNSRIIFVWIYIFEYKFFGVFTYIFVAVPLIRSDEKISIPSFLLNRGREFPIFSLILQANYEFC